VNGARPPRSHPRDDASSRLSVPERVERILATRGLTLFDVSQETRRRYGRTPHHLVPHNFYYDLSLPHYSPRIEQVLALSRLSGYRLVDWLAVFGFRPDDIAGLQLEFPTDRTFLLDAAVYDRAAWIPWFADRSTAPAPPPVVPLSQFLASTSPRRAESLAVAAGTSPFLYAKIGSQDAFAFPDLLPGSVVRADARLVQPWLAEMPHRPSERLFLVEHGTGIVCCRLYAGERGKITLRSSALPFAQTELQLGSEARVLGVLDWELRPLRAPRPEVPIASTKFRKPSALHPITTPARLGELLSRNRLRSGLSFRTASVKSRLIAEALGDSRYFCARGSLAAYEMSSRLPARLHKILSLCFLYSIGFRGLLVTAGLEPDDSGSEAIPDVLLGRSAHDPQAAEPSPKPKAQGFLAEFVQELEEIPLFLRDALSAVVAVSGLSLRDLFWVGGRAHSFHPYLKNAVLVSVNRRLKRPVFSKRKPLWEQPLYVLLLRDGTYLVSGCSLEDATLVLHPFANSWSRPKQLRHNIDAEVVGKVMALFRRLQ